MKTRKLSLAILKIGILAALLIYPPETFSQVNQCERLEFVKGSPKLTKKSQNMLNQLCVDAAKVLNSQINITVWQNDITGLRQDFGLTESRMRNLFSCLIEKNCSHLMGEVNIQQIPPDGFINTGRFEDVQICVVEVFPEIETEVYYPRYIESDTIIRGKSGTLIRFPAGFFEPAKLTEFDYRVDEIFTIDDLSSHNMSTMTSDGGLIKNFKSLKVSVIPRNPQISSPEYLFSPFTILIPVDTLKGFDKKLKMQVFVPGKKNRSFITWNKTEDYPPIEIYGGKSYYCLQTNTLGYLAVGIYEKSKKPVVLKVPKFRKIEVAVASEYAGTMEIHQKTNPETIRLSAGRPILSGANDLVISAEGMTKSGRLFVLKKAALDDFAQKNKSDYFVLRKRDFVKL